MKFAIADCGPRASKGALLSALIYALVSVAPALAQPISWTGSYAGLYAGGAWARANSVGSASCPQNINTGYLCFDAITQPNATAVGDAASGAVSLNGFTGGLQIGHNWQVGNYVYGVEGDFGAFRLDGSRSRTAFYPETSIGSGITTINQFTVTRSIKTDWLTTFRGRVGWASSNWLFYGTGGLAASRVTVANSFIDDNVQCCAVGRESASNSSIKVGWVVGTGLEVAMAQNWTMKAEYLYVDLGKASVSGTITNAGLAGYTSGVDVSTELTTHIGRLGANFKF